MKKHAYLAVVVAVFIVATVLIYRAGADFRLDERAINTNTHTGIGIYDEDNSAEESDERNTAPQNGTILSETDANNFHLEFVVAIRKTMPSLERFVVNAEVSTEERNNLLRNMREISEELRAQPDLFSSWLELAAYRRISADYEGAKRIWEFMDEFWPNSRSVYENLGNLYHFYLKDFAKAENYMIRAIDIEPRYVAGYFNLFELYTMSLTEKRSKAEDTLLAGLKNLPGNVGLQMTLAGFYKEEGKVDEARTYYEKVLASAKVAGDISTVERVDTILAEL